MDYSGPAPLSDVLINDLAMSDDNDHSTDHWPPLQHCDHRGVVSDAAGSPPRLQAPASKRPVEHDSEPGSEPSSPVAKTSKRSEPHRTPDNSPPCPPAPPVTSLPPSALPAFAPRDGYVKLAFRDNPGCDVKLRWLAEVTKAFRLDRELAEVKMSAVTSRFVYISRCRTDIIDRVMGGEFLSLTLDRQDSPVRPRKFPTYLITRYPVEAAPSLAKELTGVYTARRFHQNGTPINRLVITWSLLEPPPSVHAFSFLPCLPPCELRRMKDEQPWCFKCWGIGHISRYCSAPDKCAYCAASHATRSCPYRTSPTSTAAAASTSTSESPSPSAPDASQWKCPRCNMPGVNVWHGCTKRSSTPSAQRVVPPPPPPPPPPSLATSPSHPSPAESAEVAALRQAVAALESRCTALSARFDTIDARIDSLVSQQASTSSTLASLVESNQVVIASVTALTEKLDAVASRLERLGDLTPPKTPPPRSPSGTAPTPSSSAANKSKGKLR